MITIPKITVLMSVFNDEPRFLEASISSILAQTVTDFEFLIVDDGSTSLECKAMLDTFKMKDSRIRLIPNQKNIGLTRSLNLGLKEARGDYIARMDGDDFAENDRLAKQLAFLESHPDYILCGTYAHIIDECDRAIGEKTGPITDQEIRRHIMLSNFFTHASLFFRRQSILDLGGYSEDLDRSQDYDLIFKVLGTAKIATIPEPLVSYRVRSQSLSYSKNKLQERYALIARYRAFTRYHFPYRYWYQFLLQALVHIFLPTEIKNTLIRKLLWKKTN